MLNQPQEDINIPENILSAIEKSRNLVTINESEVLRLQSLSKTYEYNVHQLHNEEIALVEKIDGLNTLLNSLEVKKVEIETLLEEKIEEISQKSKEHDSLSEKIDIETKINGDKSTFLKNKEKELDTREIDIKDKEEELLSRENIISHKETRLKEYFK